MFICENYGIVWITIFNIQHMILIYEQHMILRYEIVKYISIYSIEYKPEHLRIIHNIRNYFNYCTF